MGETKKTRNNQTMIKSHGRIERGAGGRGSRPLPLKNHKNIGFPSKTGPGPLKNQKAAKPAFNVGPSSARL